MIKLKTSRKEDEVVSVSKRDIRTPGVVVFPLKRVRRKPPKVPIIHCHGPRRTVAEAKKRVVKSRKVIVDGVE